MQRRVGTPRQSAPVQKWRRYRKRAIAQVAEQLHRLTIFWTAGDRVNLGIDMPICDKEVQPSIVVEVHKSGAPLHVGIARLAGLRCPPDVGEALCAKIVIQIVGLISEIRYVNAQAPLVKIVAEV